MEKIIIKIQGMHCASCATILTKALSKVEGVKQVNVNYSTEKAALEYDSKITNEAIFLEAIKKKGYGGFVTTENNAQEEAKMKKKEIAHLRMNLFIGIALSLPALLFSMVFMSVPYREFIIWL